MPCERCMTVHDESSLTTHDDDDDDEHDGDGDGDGGA